MKKSAFETGLLCLVGLLVIACGPSEDGGNKAGKTSDKVVDDPEPAKEKQPDVAAPAEDDSGTVELSGKATLAGDAGAPQEVDLSLTLESDGRVSGGLTLGGVKLAVDGTVDDGKLRCWVTGGVGDPGKVRRGTFLGAKGSGESWDGTFAVSNSGAEEVMSGTWTASR